MPDYRNIVDRCRNCDREAQMLFYSMFYRQVYNSCLRILKNQAEAEEVMQETLLKVLMEHLYKEMALQMENFLKRVGINKSIDIYRKRKAVFTELVQKHENNLCREEEHTELPELTLQQVMTAMEKLPGGYSIILNLRLIEGMEYGQIAEICGISESGVRSQFARGRKKLAEIIKEKIWITKENYQIF